MKQTNSFLKKALVIATVALAIPGIALAGHHGDRDGQRFERMANKLDLSDSQREQMQAFREQNQAKHQAMREQRKQVRDLLEAGKTDEAAELAAGVAKDKVYMMANMRQKMQQVLTPEQFKKFEELQDKRKDRKSKRRHKKRHDS